MFIFNFKEVFVLNFVKSWNCRFIGFGASDPGIVTVPRLYVHFDLTGLNPRK
jgi:hypothetical protein